MAHAVKFGSLDSYGLRDEVFRVLSRAGKKGVAWEQVKHRSKLLKGANGKVNDVIHAMVSNGEIARLIIGEQVTLFSPSSTPTLSPVKPMLEHGRSGFM